MSIPTFQEDLLLFPRYKDIFKTINPEVLLDSFSKKVHIQILSFHTSSSVYSANIEGNPIDLNSYMNSHAHMTAERKKSLPEIHNLIEAYQFAEEHPLTETNFLKAHALLSKSLLSKDLQGAYRTQPIGVFSDTGLVYLAVEAEYIEKYMAMLFLDMATHLKNAPKDPAFFFYIASLYHLKLAHIHPFQDGNGRMARLLEKWVLASFLGKKAWSLSLEKYYKEHLNAYYKALNMGVNFYETRYENALDFLLLSLSCVKEGAL